MADWGPWIEHDGNGCPCKGQLVKVERFNGNVDLFVAWTRIYQPERSDTDENTSSWAYKIPTGRKIKRYRIRKPRGLQILEERLAEIDSPIQEITA